MAKHLLHLGFLLAVGALALKAVFMPPRMQASLKPGESAVLEDGVIVLKGFEVPKYQDGKPRQYVSDVHIISGMGAGKKSGKPEAVHAKISVNHPLRWNGWWLYQSSYDAAHETYTVIEAVRDPFLLPAAFAGVFLLLGAAAMCKGCFTGKSARKFEKAVDDRFAANALFSLVRFSAAAMLVILPLWIAGRILLERELPPALQSPLLVPHVGAYIVSYAVMFFAVFGIGVRLIPFGFFLMTLALVLGALWGKICWGDWWQYDPKEMWSLATWLTFAAYFHFRGSARAEKWLLRFGVLMIILTLTWVNFSKFFKGLHSYV